MLLAESDNWEEFGDATPEETSQFFADIFDDFLESEFEMVGQMSVFANEVAGLPFGWIRCIGQSIAQADYPELTNKVPPNWLSGSNIVLPDMRGQTVVGRGVHPTHGTFTQGVQAGERNVTLTVNQMPSHTHEYYAALAALPTANAGAVPAVPGRVTGISSVSGSSQSHNNMPPYVALDWCIYAGR
jgi:microcystin-dependent protein